MQELLLYTNYCPFNLFSNSGPSIASSNIRVNLFYVTGSYDIIDFRLISGGGKIGSITNLKALSIKFETILATRGAENVRSGLVLHSIR